VGQRTEVSEGAKMSDDQKPKMGRPPKEVDWNLFEKLCGIQCTFEEIAWTFGIHPHTFREKIRAHYGETFTEVFPRFKNPGLVSLRRKQYEVAMSGNVQMLKHLGEHYLDQRSLIGLEGSEQKPIVLKYAITPKTEKLKTDNEDHDDERKKALTNPDQAS
jgi:hypothetical protein